MFVHWHYWTWYNLLTKFIKWLFQEEWINMTNERDNKALHKHRTYKKGLSLLEKISTFKSRWGCWLILENIFSALLYEFLFNKCTSLDVGRNMPDIYHAKSLNSSLVCQRQSLTLRHLTARGIEFYINPCNQLCKQF